MRVPVVLIVIAVLAALLGALFWGLAARGPDRTAGTPSMTSRDVPGNATSATEPGPSRAPANDERAAANATGSASSAPIATGSTASTARSIAGRVVDGQGRAIAGARVYAATAIRTQGMPLEDLDPATVAWAGRADGTSGADGRFRVELAPIELLGGVRVGVRARGFAPLDRTLDAFASTRELGDVVLAPSVVLEGRVVDSKRAPIAGATLSRIAYDASPASMLGDAPGVLVATTSDDGTFRVDEMPSGPWILSVRAEGHPDETARGTTTSPGEHVTGLEIALADGAELRGVVKGANGELVAGAIVEAVPEAATNDGRLYAGDRVDLDRFAVRTSRVRSAADGAFVLRGLRPKLVYVCSASTERGARSRTRSARPGPEPLVLELLAQPALVFRVVDAASGAPVTEMSVRAGRELLVEASGPDGKPQRTFPEGRVRFERAFEVTEYESIELAIEALGYAPLRVPDVRSTDGGDVELGTLKLVPAPVIAVEVVDAASGALVAGADVRVEAPSSGSPANDVAGSSRRARTDERGRARVDGTVAGASLVVTHADFAPYRGEATAGATQVRLAKGARVVVRVRDARGDSIAGVRIRDDGPRGSVHAAEATHAMRTNEKGELVLLHVEPGAHVFAVDDSVDDASADAERALGPRSARLDALEGGDHEVVLTVPARVRVQGRVVEGGKPLQGATLRFVPARAGGTDARSHTGADGAYATSPLDPGVYRVLVAHPRRAMELELEATIDDAHARFDADLPLASIEGRVLDGDGRPVADASVAIEGGTGSVESQLDGSFELRGVQPDVDVIVVARPEAISGVDPPPSGVARSSPIRVARNETKRGVELVLREGAMLDVTVVAGDGRPVPGRRVRAERANEPAHFAQTSSDGVARLRGLEPGTWRVRVEPRAGESEPASANDVSVEVAIGRANAARIELPR